MLTRIALAALTAAVLMFPMAAQAKHHPHQQARIAVSAPSCGFDRHGVSLCPGMAQESGAWHRQTSSQRRAGARTAGHAGEGISRNPGAVMGERDPRPALWCAWWLRRYLNIPISAFPRGQQNMARAFARIGSPAPRGCTECIAVFSRGRGGHVGLVKSWDANGNPVILSGNYNGRVETAPHPKSRLIALRWPNRMASR